jgi:acetyltransferase-like isoleucine patch superfamily enzyme
VIVASFRQTIDRAYARQRGLDSGVDPRVGTGQLLSFLMGKAVQRARAVLRGFPGTYLARGVRIRARSQLSLGDGVSVGPRVVIDALAVDGVRLGPRSTIDESAVLRGSGVIRNLGQGIRIGERTSIGAFNFIHGGGGVTIGDDCLLGPNVTVISENHDFSRDDIPIREQGEVRMPVTIGNDVWIGAGATILAGVEIADHVIVAAGAVVTGSLSEVGVYGGVPARKIADRRGDKLNQ